MATIIDSLLVKLGLDSSEFNAGKNKVDKGLKDTGSEADKTGAKLKKTGKDGAEGFANVAASAAKFLALIGGTMAIKRFIEQTVESNAALDRLSKNLQETVSTISAWSNSAELAGGSAEGLQGTLDMLSKSQTELMLTGQSQLIPYFSALGVSIADASGKARSGGDVLLDLSDRFSKMDRTTANNMGRMMGIDQGTMNLLLKGRSEVELLVKRQKEYGAVTKQQAEESSRLKLAMTESRQSFEAFGRLLLSAATPAILKFFNLLSDLGTWVKENKGFIQAFFILIAGAITLYYLPAMIAAAAATLAAVAPMLAIVGPIAAVAAALALLWDDYQTWKRGGESLIDWSKWEPGIKKAGNAINWLKDLLGDLIYRMIAVTDAFIAIQTLDWKRFKFAAGEIINGAGKKYGESEQKAAAVTKPSAPASPSSPPTQPTAPKTYPLPESTDRQKFITSAAKKLGVPENAIEAQLRLETGVTGKSTIGNFNYGNIKAGKNYAGGTATKNVLEYDKAGKAGTESAAFRSYANVESAADDYVNMIAKKFPKAVGAANATEFASGLKAGGYATDPDYVNKISKIAGGSQPTAALGGVPGASRAAQGAGAVQAARANAPAPLAANSSSVETHIGEIKVYTAATDAKGIAADMAKSMDYLFTSQANYGLT